MRKSFKENKVPFNAYLDHLKKDCIEFAKAHLVDTTAKRSMLDAYLYVLSGGVTAFSEDKEQIDAEELAICLSLVENARDDVDRMNENIRENPYNETQTKNHSSIAAKGRERVSGPPA